MTRAAVLVRVRQYQPLIDAAAARHGLRPSLVAAVICQESAGNPYAIRPEPAFWRRYLQGIQALIRRTPSRADDHWAQYPDLASASYGLMQPLYVVALERGAVLQYPTELCDPEVNLEYGCKHLRWCIAIRGNSEAAGLLRYNGGGDRQYPATVYAWEREIADARRDAQEV